MHEIIRGFIFEIRNFSIRNIENVKETSVLDPNLKKMNSDPQHCKKIPVALKLLMFTIDILYFVIEFCLISFFLSCYQASNC
jgi:hypothetical protein